VVNIHEKYMMRAIQLGTNGLGSTAPNPMAGALVVYENKILGEGFTAPFGGAHAEVRAINAVEDKDLLSSSTLYVTLEPCVHYGKTPPCTELILKHAIPRVFIGIGDPYEKVAGKGIERLRHAGCEVETGILETACREHHRRFLCVHEKKRPYIILKWAQSKDGYLAPDKLRRENTASPFWISNPRAKQLVHKWRSEEQAILVGSTTVLDDNPRLTTRGWKGKSPLRVILDKDLVINEKHHVLDGSVQTLLLTSVDDPSLRLPDLQYEHLDFEGKVAEQVCALLLKYEIGSVLVEGGAQTLQSFIDANLWDEARIFFGGTVLGSGLRAPGIGGRQVRQEQFGDNGLILLRND
jgi:diaminohydroxyphosphoribosylaminopyrimidine deaminase/5-amino-6-(5-phosphoribosylamino)uracil reductase